jgi:putative transposase
VGGVSDGDRQSEPMSNSPVDPKSRKLRIGRFSEPYVCYSVTKNVEGRLAVLISDPVARILMDSWDYLRKVNQIKLLAFCIMPDHYHLLFCLLGEKTLSESLESTNKFSSREINKHRGSKGRFWQDGFHDRRCRDEDDIDDMATYIEHNPVRRGLVDFAEEWPYSSANPRNEWLLDRKWYAEAR